MVSNVNIGLKLIVVAIGENRKVEEYNNNRGKMTIAVIQDCVNKSIMNDRAIVIMWITTGHFLNAN